MKSSLNNWVDVNLAFFEQYSNYKFRKERLTQHLLINSIFFNSESWNTTLFIFLPIRRNFHMAMCQRSRKHNKLCPVYDIQPLPNNCLVYVNFTRFVRDKVFLVSRSNIEGQCNNAHKTKKLCSGYNFLWASWIAVIVRMLFVYNQWVCNVMTLTQNESHGAHVHCKCLCPTNIFSRLTWIWVILEFIPIVQFYIPPIYRMFLDVSNVKDSHFKSYFDVFEVSSDFAIFVEPAN